MKCALDRCTNEASLLVNGESLCKFHFIIGVWGLDNPVSISVEPIRRDVATRKQHDVALDRLFGEFNAEVKGVGCYTVCGD